ncbi:MAG: archease [Candidatus Cloacimonadia bacterium]
MMDNYQVVDHTADLAVRFLGKSLEELFINSARSLSEIIFGHPPKNRFTKITSHNIKCTADDINVLYIDFLREILFFINQEYCFFYDFDIRELSSKALDIECYAYVLSPEDLIKEIKAVTYHNVKVKKKKDHYSALVTFDI